MDTNIFLTQKYGMAINGIYTDEMADNLEYAINYATFDEKVFNKDKDPRVTVTVAKKGIRVIYPKFGKVSKSKRTAYQKIIKNIFNETVKLS
jgi:hypothetical protein